MQIETDRVPGAPRIGYEHAGAGTGVLFLHGIGGNRSNWREQLVALASQFHAVAWDARGYGLSDDAREPWEFGDFSADLLRLLDHLHWDRANLVGLSMGGCIAQDFYARHPARVRTLCLCDTVPAWVRAEPAAQEQFLRLRQKPLLEGKTPRDIAPAVARSLLGPGAGPEHYERLVESLSALRKSSYLETLRVFAQRDSRLRPEDVDVPTLLIFGAEDPLTPPSIGQFMQQAIRDSRLSLIEAAGHLPNIERPEEFNRLLLDFLQKAGR